MLPDPLASRPSASVATLTAAVAILGTILGGGTATLLFLAGIQGDLRVVNSQMAAMQTQLTRLENRLDRPNRQP